MRNINIIGERFGRLIVVRQEGTYKSGTKLYICRCDCGGECQTSLPHLRNEEVKSCGCLAKETASQNGKLGKKSLLGQKFGRLTVIEEADHTKYGIKWICQCDCGNEAMVLGVNLRKKDGTQSCGCLHDEAITDAGKKRRAKNPWAVEMYHYESGAKQRNLCFDLTEEQFKKLILSPCHYCGTLPLMKCQGAELKEQSMLRNGIDRKCPNTGYVIDNCVSCCWTCNEDKSNKSYEQFLQDTKRRYDYLRSNNLI